MNLNSLADKMLIEKTEGLVRDERELLTCVLHHLLEIERRRLFSSMGYKSLFDFAVRHLGYPEDQAYRRISAMRLLKTVPEIENKIIAGEISLTHIGLAQTLFRQEKKLKSKEMSTAEKLSVIDQIANKPVREAERITLSLSSQPETMKPDRVSALSESHVELKFTASAELLQKAERLKGMLAHKHPNISLGELFDKLCDLGLSEWDKSTAPDKTPLSDRSAAQDKSVLSDKSVLPSWDKSVVPNESVLSDKSELPDKTGGAKLRGKSACAGMVVMPESVLSNVVSDKSVLTKKSALPNKAMPIKAVSAKTTKFAAQRKRCVTKAQIIRDVFKRAGSKCENCNSTYALEVDHITPRAKGGGSEQENLRLLCRTCNQRAAVKEFGLQKMDQHINYVNK